MNPDEKSIRAEVFMVIRKKMKDLGFNSNLTNNDLEDFEQNVLQEVENEYNQN